MKIAAQLASQGQRLGQSIGMEEPKGETRVGSSPSGHTLGVDGAFVTNPATTCSRSGDSGLSLHSVSQRVLRHIDKELLTLGRFNPCLRRRG